LQHTLATNLFPLFLLLQAKYIDPSGNPYDVLLDEYEKGMTSARLDEIFTEVSVTPIGHTRTIQWQLLCLPSSCSQHVHTWSGLQQERVFQHIYICVHSGMPFAQMGKHSATSHVGRFCMA
jgi:Zn-dependent M32 family carboxypeptidase